MLLGIKCAQIDAVYVSCLSHSWREDDGRIHVHLGSVLPALRSSVLYARIC